MFKPFLGEFSRHFEERISARVGSGSELTSATSTDINVPLPQRQRQKHAGAAATAATAAMTNSAGAARPRQTPGSSLLPPRSANNGQQHFHIEGERDDDVENEVTKIFCKVL